MVNPADYEEPGKGRARAAFHSARDNEKKGMIIEVPEKIKKHKFTLELTPSGPLKTAVHKQVEETQDAIKAKHEMQERLDQERKNRLELNNKDKDNER